MENRISRSLIARFSRDMAELYTDLLGLGEAVESGALFVAAQRLVDAAVCFDTSADSVTAHNAAAAAELLATTVLVRLRQIDNRGLIPRPGRRRRLYGLSLSMLRAIRAQAPARTGWSAAPVAPTAPAAPTGLHNRASVHYIET